MGAGRGLMDEPLVARRSSFMTGRAATVTLGLSETPSEMPPTQSRSVPSRWLPRLVLGALAGLAYAAAVRGWVSHWGANVEEASTPLPGDDLVGKPAYVTTRAVAVRAPAEAVWPWLMQLGQGRGGFYTYDRLEQMVGAGIRSADHIVPELQHIAVGDTVALSPAGGPKVALLDPGRALVLSETMDLRTGRSIPPVPLTAWAMDWTWSFTLRPMLDGATRLVVRTRADYRPHGLLAPAMVLFLEPTHFVMERGMLLGIKRRAERAPLTPATGGRGFAGPLTPHTRE